MSRFLLDGFCDPKGDEEDPYLWIADVRDGSVRRRSPKNALTVAGFYDWRGLDIESAETVVSRFESRAAPAVRAMRQPGYTLTARDKYGMSQYAAMQLLRLRHVVEGAERRLAAEAWDSIQARAAEFAENTEDAVARIRASKAVEQMARNYAISSLLEGALKHLAGVFFSMRWVVLRADTDAFFTTDQPVVLMSSDRRRIEIDFESGVNPELEVFVPLSSRAALLMHQRPGAGFETRLVSGDDALQIQWLAMLPAMRHLAFSPSEPLGKWVIEQHSANAPIWHPNGSRGSVPGGHPNSPTCGPLKIPHSATRV